MLPRGFEVLLVAVLVMATTTTVFQFMNHQVQLQNQQMLRDLLIQLRSNPSTSTNAAPPTTNPPTAPATKPVTPSMAPGVPPPSAPAVVRNAPGPSSVAVKPTGVSQVAANAVPSPNVGAPVVVAPPAGDTTPAAPVDDSASLAAWETNGSTVTQVVTQLLDGRYAEVVKLFNANMASELPPPELATVIDPVRKAHGAMKHILGHAPLKARLPENMHAFVVTTEMSDGHKVLFTITLDDKQRVSGLLMK
jgi:hypothetical protein